VPSEVVGEILEVASWEEAVIRVATFDGLIVGAAWSYNVGRKVDVMKTAQVSPEATYIAEIFVSSVVRGRGVARDLVDSLLSHSPVERGVVRTSVAQPIIIRLFERLGWEIIASETVLSRKCINGVTADLPDERVILTGVIRK
jgi:predicted GNAT family acetyltransferase